MFVATGQHPSAVFSQDGRVMSVAVLFEPCKHVTMAFLSYHVGLANTLHDIMGQASGDREDAASCWSEAVNETPRTATNEHLW